MARKRHYGFKCHFCRDPLQPMEFSLTQFLLGIFGIGRYYCPHCFQISVLPATWLRLLLLPPLTTWRWMKRVLRAE